MNHTENDDKAAVGGKKSDGEWLQKSGWKRRKTMTEGLTGGKALTGVASKALGWALSVWPPLSVELAWSIHSLGFVRPS